jgi:hypothetical protein
VPLPILLNLLNAYPDDACFVVREDSDHGNSSAAFFTTE